MTHGLAIHEPFFESNKLPPSKCHRSIMLGDQLNLYITAIVYDLGILYNLIHKQDLIKIPTLHIL